jgi:hypothetical protein
LVQASAISSISTSFKTACKCFYKSFSSYPEKKKKSMPFGMKFPQADSLEEHQNPKKGYLKLPKTGRLQYLKSRKLEGSVHPVTLRKEGFNYFVSVLCYIGDKYDTIVIPPKPELVLIVGSHTLSL